MKKKKMSCDSWDCKPKVAMQGVGPGAKVGYEEYQGGAGSALEAALNSKQWWDLGLMEKVLDM